MPKNNFHRTIKYVCSECGREVGQNNLVAHVVQFRDLGQNRRVIMTRTVAWLCKNPNGDQPSCVEKIPAWNSKQFVSAPGWADVKSTKR